MSFKNLDYTCQIERGHTPINDNIIDFLVQRIRALKPGSLLDVGCNTGFLLTELGFGSGIDASLQMVEAGKAKGLDIIHGWAEQLPYDDKHFDIVVLSCVLEQTEDWRVALEEAKRVGKIVIGINPIPGSRWGVTGGWVKSIIPPSAIGAMTMPVDNERYYFEIFS